MKKIIKSVLISLVLFLIANVSLAATVTVTYDLSLNSVRAGFEDYFGESATATITYDLDAAGEPYLHLPEVITIYENAITSYSLTSYNSDSDFNLSLVGSNSNIQIHNNAGSSDRFRSPYEHNGSTNVPAYVNATDIGIEIDQLYSSDTFDSMDLPSVYPTTLGSFNHIAIQLEAAGGEEAIYNITGVTSTLLNDNLDADYDGALDVSDNCPNIANPDQADFDNDNSGDLCDADDDNDGMFDQWEIDNGFNPNDSSDCPSWVCGPSSNGWRSILYKNTLN